MRRIPKMPNPNAKKMVDDVIAKAPDFAKPICKKLREIILKADSGIEEDFITVTAI